MRNIVIGLVSGLFALGAFALPAPEVNNPDVSGESQVAIGTLLTELGYDQVTPQLAELTKVNASYAEFGSGSCVGYVPPPNCVVIFNDGDICAERCSQGGQTIDRFCDCTAS